MSSTNLGPLEQTVMKIIWQHAEVSVRQVWQTLQQERPIAYTTVMTLMHRLTQKGYLTKTKRGKTHWFTASHNQEQTLHQLVQKTLQSFVDRFGEEAIAAFAEETHQRSTSPRSTPAKKA